MKYIINIPDDIQKIIGLRQDYSLIYVDMTPYTEPDRKAIEDEVWEFVRELIHYNNGKGMVDDELQSCFGHDLYSQVFKHLSYQEAKAKYDEWKRKKEEIHVGDEVEYIDGNTNAFVSYFDGEMCDLICADGSVAEDICLNMLRPTGRKCPEVLKLLETLQREYDDQ